MSHEDYENMVAKAAKALCKNESESCSVDPEDNWKIYGEEFINDARAMLEAIGAQELLGTLQEAIAFIGYLPRNPEAIKARMYAAIAKATGGAS